MVYLSIDSALDGPAIYGYVRLFVLELVALCDADHLLHQIQSCDTLSDGMLHLREKDTLTNILQHELLRTNVTVHAASTKILPKYAKIGIYHQN